MKRVLLSLAIVLLAAVSARAEIIGAWSDGVAVGEYTVYKLTVTPTEGEVMNGFDANITAPGEVLNYYSVSGLGGETKTVFYDTAGLEYTYFLLDGSNLIKIDEDCDVSHSYLKGSFSASSTGDYSAGWDGALDLLQVAVLTSSGVTPDDFTYSSNSTYGDVQADNLIAIVGYGAECESLEIIMEVPEPSTLALLACGLLGLAAYAWRKRK